jgi:hypothetical protein
LGAIWNYRDALEAEVSRRAMAGGWRSGWHKGCCCIGCTARPRAWPAGEPYAVRAAGDAGLILPVVLISSLGHMKPRQAAVALPPAPSCTVVAARCVASMGVPNYWAGRCNGQVRMRRPVLMVFGAVFLFIAHALAMAAARWPPHRQLRHAYFGVEAGYAAVVFGFFVGALWACCSWARAVHAGEAGLLAHLCADVVQRAGDLHRVVVRHAHHGCAAGHRARHPHLLLVLCRGFCRWRR